MTNFSEIVLFDSAEGIGVTDEYLLGTDVPQLIEPLEALRWIAAGQFGDYVGPLPWIGWDAEAVSLTTDRKGRTSLAEEIIMNAIVRGKLRCAQTEDYGEDFRRLSYIDPVFFTGKQLQHDWPDGLTISVLKEKGTISLPKADAVQLDQFWFFWDEVVSLAPQRITPAVLIPSPVSSQRIGPVGLPAVQSRAGRNAGTNGLPIAMFALRVMKEGILELNKLTNDALGAMLTEEYRRVLLKDPSPKNAAGDARGVLKALMQTIENPLTDRAK